MKIVYIILLLIVLCFAGCPKPGKGTSPEELLPLLPGTGSSSSLAIAYAGTPFTFTVNSVVSGVAPILSEPATLCNSIPALPTGLTLNPSTCAISGTPTVMQAPASYTIKATNDKLSGETTIRIAVSCAVCRFFPTATSYSGNLGGASGADAKCNTDANRPSTTSTYKALITDSSRRACSTANCSGGISENQDWVLYPNKTYYRADGTTVVMTTNSAGITSFPLNAGMATGAANTHWTGMNADWTNNTNSCSNWISTSGNGTAGVINNTSSFAIFNLSQSCNQPNVFLMCVER